MECSSTELPKIHIISLLWETFCKHSRSVECSRDHSQQDNNVSWQETWLWIPLYQHTKAATSMLHVLGFRWGSSHPVVALSLASLSLWQRVYVKVQHLQRSDRRLGKNTKRSGYNRKSSKKKSYVHVGRWINKSDPSWLERKLYLPRCISNN